MGKRSRGHSPFDHCERSEAISERGEPLWNQDPSQFTGQVTKTSTALFMALVWITRPNITGSAGIVLSARIN